MCSGVGHFSLLHVQQSRELFSAACAAVGWRILLHCMCSSGAEQTTLVCCMCSSGAVCSAMLHGQQWSTLPFSVEQSEMSGAPHQTGKRVQRAQYSATNRVESTDLHCKWSGENSAPLQKEQREQSSAANRA